MRENTGGETAEFLETLYREALAEESPGEVAEALRGWVADRQRLYLLRGVSCPLCRRLGRASPSALAWTGISLACPHGHGWSNPDALREDLLASIPARARRQRERD